MASTPEGVVKAKIKHWLRSQDTCWFFMPAAHGYGVNGIPDIVGCYRGSFFAIEVKAPGKMKNVTALQAMQIREINAAQGFALATDNLERVLELFRLMDIATDGVTDMLETRIA